MKLVTTLVFLCSIAIGIATKAEAKSKKVCGHNHYYDWDQFPDPTLERRYRTLNTMCFRLDENGPSSVSTRDRAGIERAYQVTFVEKRIDWRQQAYLYVEMNDEDPATPMSTAFLRFDPENSSRIRGFSADTPENYLVMAPRVWQE